jgi:hypothetical protein
MAISTPTNKAALGDDNNLTAYVVTSQTYTAGRLYLLAINASRASLPPDDPTFTGVGTWTPITFITWGSSNTKRLTLYRFLPSSTVTGTVTATYANQLNAASWNLTEIVSGFDSGGTNGSGAITQSNTQLTGTGGTSSTVTLAAFATGGIGFAVFATDAVGDIVPANGYTELSQVGTAAPSGTLQSQYRLTDADPSVTFAAARAGGVGVEIKQASATAYTMPADAGAFTETGQAASLERGVKLAAMPASLLATGTAANLAVGYRLLALGAEMTLTGTDATLVYAPRVDYPMLADSGDFTLDGTDAAFSYARLMAALQAVYAFAGTNARLDWSGYVPPPTPQERIYFVAAEVRVCFVDAQDRTYSVAADRRELAIAGG